MYLNFTSTESKVNVASRIKENKLIVINLKYSKEV